MQLVTQSRVKKSGEKVRLTPLTGRYLGMNITKQDIDRVRASVQAAHRLLKYTCQAGTLDGPATFHIPVSLLRLETVMFHLRAADCVLANRQLPPTHEDADWDDPRNPPHAED